MTWLATILIQLAVCELVEQPMREFRDKWCLVTGASSGIGAEFARQLAGTGARLVLVARREARLVELSEELERNHGSQTRVVALDLLGANAVSTLRDSTQDLDIELLVNNAGFGHYGEFSEMQLDRATRMLQLNVQRVVELTHVYLPEMLARRRGAIINVSSTSAFQAVPFMSVYAATKAFVLHFSEGLWAETRKKGVTIYALCPGFTQTEFFDEASLPNSIAFGTKSVEYVVADSLRAVAKGRQFSIPGWVNYFVAMSTRFVSRRLGAVNGAKVFHPKRHNK